MPVREETFRIGCGRYLQRKGAIAELGSEVLRYGKAPLVVGGPTALSLTREKIEKAFAGVCPHYKIIAHPGTCNEERALELAQLAKAENLDVIVGVGGGVIMDFAKLIGDVDRLPVINVPTSSATCAAYTPLSVRYTPDGRTVGSKHYGYELNAVVADTQVIATQPPRLLLAGVFDALAKFLEIKQRFTEQTQVFPIGLDYAYILSKSTYSFLSEKTAKCLCDLAEGQVTDDVEKVLFATIATTGVISGIARGSNQCALAHKFYETTRTLFPETARPYLHGEIVGVGLLLQNHFNGEAENNAALLELMRQNGMPYRVEDIGIAKTEETFRDYYRKLCDSSAIESEAEAEKLKFSLEYLWNMV